MIYLTAKLSICNFLTVSSETEINCHEKLQYLMGDELYQRAILREEILLASYNYKSIDGFYTHESFDCRLDWELPTVIPFTMRDLKLCNLLGMSKIYIVTAVFKQIQSPNPNHVREKSMNLLVAAKSEAAAEAFVASRLRRKLYRVEANQTDGIPTLVIQDQEGFVTYEKGLSQHVKDCDTLKDVYLTGRFLQPLKSLVN